MHQAEDGRGVQTVMGYFRPGPAPRRAMTATQVKWFSNLIGSWLVYGVGLSVGDAARVLSRRISERGLRRIVHGMAPVSALPDPNGFANGWKFLFSPNPRESAQPVPRRPRPRSTRTRPRPKAARSRAGSGRTSTAPATTS